MAAEAVEQGPVRAVVRARGRDEPADLLHYTSRRRHRADPPRIRSREYCRAKAKVFHFLCAKRSRHSRSNFDQSRARSDVCQSRARSEALALLRSQSLAACKVSLSAQLCQTSTPPVVS